MTRTQYINKVKAKLEEISPFEEPSSLQALGESTVVKPILSYIDDSLDEAAKDCLNNLPLSLLASDIEEDNVCLPLDTRGVGHVNGYDEYNRLARVRCNAWDRDVTAFITSSDPIYLLQQNRYTRGGYSKPVVAYVPEKKEWELYSFPHEMGPSSSSDCVSVHATLYYIDCTKKAERVESHIEDFIILRCATIVSEILNNNNSSTFMAEYSNKLNDILK